MEQSLGLFSIRRIAHFEVLLISWSICLYKNVWNVLYWHACARNIIMPIPKTPFLSAACIHTVSLHSYTPEPLLKNRLFPSTPNLALYSFHFSVTSSPPEVPMHRSHFSDTRILFTIREYIAGAVTKWCVHKYNENNDTMSTMESYRDWSPLLSGVVLSVWHPLPSPTASPPFVHRYTLFPWITSRCQSR